jgi:hypothetical protein
MKFHNLLYRIQTQDKTLMKEEGEYFNDSDFEEEDKKTKKDKKVTYKDVVRREALKKIEGADGSESDASDAQIRNAFKKYSKGKKTNKVLMTSIGKAVA